MNIPELLQKRAKLGTDARAILDAAGTEARSLNAEEAERYAKMEADITAINGLIESERKLSAATGELKAVAGDEKRVVAPNADYRKKLESEEYRSAFLAYVRHGERDIAPEQRQLLSEVRAASALSAVTGASGQYTVPQGFYTEIFDAMKWYGGMRNAGCTVLSTATGNTLPIPTDNDTGNTGELVAENATIGSGSDPEMAFGQVLLHGYKFSSKPVKVPLELLQDSYFDVSAFVAKKLGIRLGRVTNNYFSVGNGSNAPTGVGYAPTTGVTGATGQTVTCTVDDLLTLIHKVDPAYRSGSKFMFNDSTALMLEKLKDGAGRPILNSSLLGIAGEISAGAVDQRKFLLGYPVVINNDIPVMAASAKSVLFGDFSTYFIRDVMDIMLIRLQELYMANGQVGFVAFYRGDGQPVDAGMHPIQAYVNSAT